jgi:hypothetical protein
MTIPAPHQLRVLNEEAELAERHAKLCAFLQSDKITSVDFAGQERLGRQCRYMHDLLLILRERIANF